MCHNQIVHFHGLVDTALLSVLDPTVFWLALVVARLLARELEAAVNKIKSIININF